MGVVEEADDGEDGRESCARRAAAVAADDDGQQAPSGIWLHSLRYALPELGLRFESAPPRFAAEDFDEV